MDERKHERIIVRLMDPRGYYPRSPFLSDDAVFDVSEHLAYSAVRSLDRHYDDSELQWASIEEIRLWAAMALSCPEGKGFHRIYPSHRLVSLDPLDLPSWNLADEDCRSALTHALQLGGPYFDLSLAKHYTLHHYQTNSHEQMRLLRSIQDSEMTEPGLVRGLVCLVKSQMLFDHWQFGEEAALVVFTAMEGALSALRARLSSDNRSPVTFADVYQVIETHVRHGKGMSAYFKQCWDKRIALAHTDSRVGADPIPFLLADDVYDTYTALVSLYRLLLIGENRPELA